MSIKKNIKKNKAADGNRTRNPSLGSLFDTISTRPLFSIYYIYNPKNINTKIFFLNEFILFILVISIIYFSGCGRKYVYKDRKAISIPKEVGNNINNEFSFLNKKKEGIYYTLKAGEGLYSVSQSFKVPIEVIIRENNISNIYTIPAGTVLFIPLQNRELTQEEPFSDTEEKVIPVRGKITGRFNTLRKNVKLKGIEYTTYGRCNVYSITGGVVCFISDTFGSFEQSVIIRISPSEYIFYGNVGKICVNLGQRVFRGDLIGIKEPGSRPLHIKYIKNNVLVDPEVIIR